MNQQAGNQRVLRKIVADLIVAGTVNKPDHASAVVTNRKLLKLMLVPLSGDEIFPSQELLFLLLGSGVDIVVANAVAPTLPQTFALHRKGLLQVLQRSQPVLGNIAATMVGVAVGSDSASRASSSIGMDLDGNRDELHEVVQGFRQGRFNPIPLDPNARSKIVEGLANSDVALRFLLTYPSESREEGYR